MNLIGDPWVPVLDENGNTREVGLETLFGEAGELVDLALRPIQRIAVMRLLLAIAYAARGAPKNVEEWVEWRDAIVPAALDYLGQRYDCFELYGDRPFLQILSLERKQNAVVDGLDLGLSAGNNDTLFDHGARPEGRTHPPAWSALQLLTYQCFKPGGLVGDVTWAGRKMGRSSEHAPAVEGAALQALVRGPVLLDSIHMNLIPSDLLPGPIGSPVWDLDLSDPDSGPLKELIASVLGRLVPISRAVLLEGASGKFTLGRGLSYPKLVEGGRELAATVVARRDGSGHFYLRVDPAKHPWRELGSILALGFGGNPGGPLALQNLHRLRRAGTVDVWIGGLAVEKAKVIDEAEWNLAVPLDLLDEACLLVYRTGVELADKGAESLRRATRDYAKSMKAEPKGFRKTAVRSYWSTLDQQYNRLVHIAEKRTDFESWRHALLSAMHDAYATACPAATPRQLEAFVAGRQHLQLPAHEGAGRQPEEVAT